MNFVTEKTVFVLRQVFLYPLLFLAIFIIAFQTKIWKPKSKTRKQTSEFDPERPLGVEG